MAGVRVDPDVLTEWARTLDRLPSLADGLPTSGPTPASAGLPAVAVLYRTNLDALRALADVVASFDHLTDQLGAATMAATANYSIVDGQVAAIVGSCVR